MIRSVKNINFSLIERSNFYNKYQIEIKNYWEYFFWKNPTTFDGNILSVIQIEDDDCNFNVTIELLKFSYIVYAQRYGKFKTRSLFSSGYILTSDNFIGLVLDQRNRIDLAGGMASLEDFLDGEYKPEMCLFREVKEEIGLDLSLDNFKVTLKYFKYPDKKEDGEAHFPVGLIYEIKTNYKMKDIRKMYDVAKRDGEIKDIILKGEYEPINDISQEANDLIERMLKLDPKERITIEEILKHPWLKHVDI